MWLRVAVTCLLVAVVGIGVVFASYKKPWLMDDYRAGYAEGVRLADEQDTDDVTGLCEDSMAAAYGVPPEYDQFITPEPPSAFFLGCYHAVGGVQSDWWNVSGYLTA